MTVRSDIVAEFIERAKTLGSYPRRELPATEEGPYPVIYVFEDLETVKVVKPGIYQKQLPIWIEQLVEVASIEAVYEYGNEMLQNIAQAIETDERFNELVVKYWMSENVIAPRLPTVADVLVRYDFVYIDKFYGYEPKRH